MPGEIPLLFAIPVLLFAGLACLFGGLASLSLPPGHWWKAAILCSSGVVFLWMGVQSTIGWRHRRAKRRQ